MYSEYGDTWHKAGMLGKKQNVFDDFIAAAEYLVSRKYTNPSKLCIQGGSNGGLLVCACANQRPDLFQCVVSRVGSVRAFRYMMGSVFNWGIQIHSYQIASIFLSTSGINNTYCTGTAYIYALQQASP